MTPSFSLTTLQSLRSLLQRGHAACQRAAPFVVAIVCAEAWRLHETFVILLALLLPAVWAANAKSKLHGAAIWFLYYLAVSSDMTPEVSQIFPETPLALSLLTWGSCAAALSLPWYFAWEDRRGAPQRPTRILLALLATTIPPIGIIAWTNPLLSSGLLFPGLGLTGLLLTALASIALVLEKAPRVAMTFVLASISVGANWLVTEQDADPAWFGQNTSLGKQPEANQYGEWLRVNKGLARMADQAFDEGASVIVFPEMVAGNWSQLTTYQWIDTAVRALEPGKGLLIGATTATEDGGYVNGAVVIDESGMRFANGRSPVPFGVWRPWERHSAKANWFGSGRLDFAGREVALSVCYEDFMVFTQAMALHTIGREPAAALVSIANNWFGNGRKGTFIQDASVRLMARLFNVPVIRAVNS